MGYIWSAWYVWRVRRSLKKQFMNCPAARQAPGLYSRMAQRYDADMMARRYDSRRRG